MAEAAAEGMQSTVLAERETLAATSRSLNQIPVSIRIVFSFHFISSSPPFQPHLLRISISASFSVHTRAAGKRLPGTCRHTHTHPCAPDAPLQGDGHLRAASHTPACGIFFSMGDLGWQHPPACLRAALPLLAASRCSSRARARRSSAEPCCPRGQSSVGGQAQLGGTS